MDLLTREISKPIRRYDRGGSSASTDFRYGSRLCENSDAELARRTFVSIPSNKKRTALAAAVERRNERKQFCAFSALTRFHTAWVKSTVLTLGLDFGLPSSTDIAGPARLVRFVPPPDIPERHNADVPDSRPNFYCPDYSSDRGRYQTNPHGPNQTIVQ